MALEVKIIRDEAGLEQLEGAWTRLLGGSEAGTGTSLAAGCGRAESNGVAVLHPAAMSAVTRLESVPPLSCEPIGTSAISCISTLCLSRSSIKGR